MNPYERSIGNNFERPIDRMVHGFDVEWNKLIPKEAELEKEYRLTESFLDMLSLQRKPDGSSAIPLYTLPDQLNELFVESHIRYLDVSRREIYAARIRSPQLHSIPPQLHPGRKEFFGFDSIRNTIMTQTSKSDNAEKTHDEGDFWGVHIAYYPIEEKGLRLRAYDISQAVTHLSRVREIVEAVGLVSGLKNYYRTILPFISQEHEHVQAMVRPICRKYQEGGREQGQQDFINIGHDKRANVHLLLSLKDGNIYSVERNNGSYLLTTASSVNPVHYRRLIPFVVDNLEYAIKS